MKNEILFIINTGLKLICAVFGTLILFSAFLYIPKITIIYTILRLILIMIEWKRGD